MSRIITEDGTITVLPGWQLGVVGKDKIRDMMVASSKCQMAIKQENVTEHSQPRKRRRLTDLSLDEKIRRKKLKNREAAQNSRDKKKAYVTDLESTVNNLTELNDQLTQKMDLLCEENKRLLAENARLEGLLAGRVDKDATNRPAAPACPLQKDLHLATLPASSDLSLLALLCLMSLIGWSTVFNHRIYHSYRSLLTLCRKQPSTLRKSSPVHQRQKRWWGPRQKSWNPMPLAAHLMLLKKILLSSQFQEKISSLKMP